MFDFGITLPFVAITFLTMMAVLNALFYAPVSAETCIITYRYANDRRRTT